MKNRSVPFTILALLLTYQLAASQEIHWEKPFELNIIYMQMTVDSAGVIYAVGDPGIPFKQGYRFNRSTDNGTTWSRSNTHWDPNWSPVNVLASDAPGSLYLGGDLGLSHSTDSGNTWSAVESAGWGVTAFGVGRGGLLLIGTLFNSVGRSTDGGISWQFDTLDPGRSGISFAFAGDGSILHSTTDGIYRSTDNGVTWNKSSDGIDAPPLYRAPWDYAPLAIAPWGDIYAAYLTMLYRSTDNGQTWSVLYEAEKQITSILVTTQDEIFIGILAHRGILRSTDRGVTWEQTAQDVLSQDPNDLPVNVTQILGTPSGVLVAATDSAGVIRTTTEHVAGVAPADDIIVSRTAVPNPATSTATIHLTLPSTGRLRAELVNSHGEQVTVVMDDVMTAGEHTLLIDSRELPAGTYFCHLTLDGRSIPSISPIVVVR